MSMLGKNEISAIAYDLQEAENLLRRKVSDDVNGEVTMTANERRLLWNAVQYGQRLLSILVPMQTDVIKALEMLDAEGIWTGADDLVHDRVRHLILDRPRQTPPRP